MWNLLFYCCCWVCVNKASIVFTVSENGTMSEEKIKTTVEALCVLLDSKWSATTSSTQVGVNCACNCGDFYFGGGVWRSLTHSAAMCWCFQEKRTFQIPWMHAARHGWDLEKDAPLFMKWAIHTGTTCKNVHAPVCLQRARLLASGAAATLLMFTWRKKMMCEDNVERNVH